MTDYGKPEAYKNTSTHEMRRKTNVNSFEKIELNREDFQALLESNQHVIVFKFGADWCKPCNSIKNSVCDYVKELGLNIKCYDVDVDDSFDLYAFLKSKKQVSGIPSFLAYRKGNTSFAADSSISGSNLKSIEDFFKLINNY